jgi:type I restriction enzyme, S subunit
MNRSPSRNGQYHRDPRLPDWLDGIPNHWQKLPNRGIFHERIERGFDDEQMLTITIRGGVQTQDAFLANSPKKDSSNQDKSKYKLVRPGDIAYNKMRMWQGAVGLSEHRGLVSPAYIVLSPRIPINLSFYHYLFRNPLYTTTSYRWSYGICDDMLSLRYEDFKQVYSPVPPREEQDTIVAFLDRKLEKLDRFIANKRRLIELLEEEKLFIRSNAVIRGTAKAEGELVDSNVWCEPQIPSDWTVTTLGRCLRNIEQGWSPVAANGDLLDDQWGILTLSAVKKGRFHQHENKPLPEELDPKPQHEVHSGDFLLTRSNTRSLVGDVCIVGETRSRLMLSDLIYRLTIDEKNLCPRFLLHQLLAQFGRNQIESDARGSSSTMVKVSQSHISRWILFLPPTKSEQEEIVGFIEDKHRTIDTTIDKALNEIDLMNEFRTSLIAEAVTGKIDVRSKT